MNVIEWSGCYEDSWRGHITDASFAHPAKFARGLLTRIIRFGLAEGYWRKGDVVLDPFGGIGTGGIVCASHGLQWVGVELESRFAALAEENFALHRRTWEGCGDPLPRIICGDSRGLSGLLGAAGVVVSSPPYAGLEVADLPRGKEGGASGGIGTQFRKGNRAPNARLKADGTPTDGYGATAGQLGAMRAGTVGDALAPAGLVSSPPYEEASVGNNQRSFRPNDGRPTPRFQRDLTKEEKADVGYSDNADNLGNARADTFWSAAHAICGQCALALPPGAVTVWVVKDYVRDRKRVPFCDDWARLLEATGFDVFLRVHALLNKDLREPGLFGAREGKVVSRKSFFRRLAEKKGSPAIDFEEVVFARRRGVAGAGRAGAAVVISPPYADDILAGGYRDPEKESARERRYLERHPELVGRRPKAAANYGSSPGQLGAMRAGTVADALGEGDP